jgi:hypothetical protein
MLERRLAMNKLNPMSENPIDEKLKVLSQIRTGMALVGQANKMYSKPFRNPLQKHSFPW